MRPHKKPVNSMPSDFLSKFAEEVALNANGPIVDIACGYGRNASLISSFGPPVLCVDNDKAALAFIDGLDINQVRENKLLPTLELDLANSPWPFKEGSCGAIINIHFLTAKLLDNMLNSLKIGGYLLIETIGGNGLNYRELLPQGYIKGKLAESFDFRFYKEKKVGPSESDASSVKLLALRRK